MIRSCICSSSTSTVLSYNGLQRWKWHVLRIHLLLLWPQRWTQTKVRVWLCMVLSSIIVCKQQLSNANCSWDFSSRLLGYRRQLGMGRHVSKELDQPWCCLPASIQQLHEHEVDSDQDKPGMQLASAQISNISRTSSSGGSHLTAAWSSVMPFKSRSRIRVQERASERCFVIC